MKNDIRVCQDVECTTVLTGSRDSLEAFMERLAWI
jgi:hypothetical protein